ncbi:hypothetical protein M9H77_25315 [Catharanthus roseus]|uniref:Uncharacterized protein n=1 Tax=Catharanthus roseus TaxID=4058 RepID=A0ACC0A986_CATRO|nr:hypothetical protein M9H77_25315 [Catharanthus roseus]
MFYRDSTSTDLCRRFGRNNSSATVRLPLGWWSLLTKLIWAWSRIPALRPQLITDVQADLLAPLGAIWCTSFDCSQLATHTLVTYTDQLDFIPSDQAWLQWRLRVRHVPALAAEVLSYPSDECIRWYRSIVRIYISNPANCDTHSHGYQPAEVDRRMITSTLQDVDDMASVVIQEPTSEWTDDIDGVQHYGFGHRVSKKTTRFTPSD